MKDTTEKGQATHFGTKIISIDEGEIRNHLDQMVKKSVEDTLNRPSGCRGGRIVQGKPVGSLP